MITDPTTFIMIGNDLKYKYPSSRLEKSITHHPHTTTTQTPNVDILIPRTTVENVWQAMTAFL
jgi:hypothetical protein